MEFIKKYKVAIISIVALIIMLLGVLVWNKIVDLQKEDKETTNVTEQIDVSDVDNIINVESKLGQPMKITQSYLLKYTTAKSGVWYMSTATVKKISTKNDEAIITLVSEDNEYSLNGTIAKDKVDVKKGDVVNFVGTVDFVTGGIDLTKISKDKINYVDVNVIDFSALVDDIGKILKNQFVISGYKVTDGNKYKLFESKTAYNKTDKVGTYFTLEWKDEFSYTGNSDVTVQCYIGDTYKLRDCELMEK